MIECSESRLELISVHYVGSKLGEEGVKLSKTQVNPDENIRELLQKYFLSSFKSNEYYNLHHESDLNLNEVYTYAGNIFDHLEDFHEQSINLARHLYEQATHPKVRGGEFYAVYIQDCIVDGEVTDALGLFKSESKETYLKIFHAKNNFEINSDDGININKLDKGCLIFNTEREKGFLVAIVDNISKGNEAQYWKDNFLHVRYRADNYHHTKNILSLCKNFVTEKLPEEFEVTKADQADLLNKSVKFFKEKETFDMNSFTKEVIKEPQVIKAFKDYKKQYQFEQDVEFADEFDISAPAVKKQQRVFKSVIKLDKNFHIYVHGNREMIEKGYDKATGMHYYKLYFTEED
ncbi:MAG: nucleoid-associated protein [Bacteroidia bacterium]|nr:nucleoid-associated protein [Bacteroidia bacterium]